MISGWQLLRERLADLAARLPPLDRLFHGVREDTVDRLSNFSEDFFLRFHQRKAKNSRELKTKRGGHYGTRDTSKGISESFGGDGSDSCSRKCHSSFADIASAAELQPIQLSKPQPQTDGGNPALQLLQKRASSRELSPQPLPAEILSELLWAAFGINRADGRRTAPTASNRQDMDIYVILAQGCYLYDPRANQLNPVVAEDLHGMAGTQPFAKDAPVNLIYVCDYSRMSNIPEETKILFSGFHAGAISENVYL